MAYEQKPGQGSLFINNKKEKENQPDFNGSITTPDGKQWKVSGWKKTSGSGIEYTSLSVQEPKPFTPASDEQKAANKGATSPANVDVTVQPDDLPF